MNHDEVDGRIRCWAQERRLPASCVARWLELEGEDRSAVLQVAERLRLRTGQFVTAFELLDEIGVRDTIGAAGIIAMPEIARLVDATDSAPGRAARMIEALRRLRFPRLYQTAAALAAQTEALKLPANIRVTWPTELGSGELRVVLTAHNGDELGAALDLLAERRAALCRLADDIG